MELSIRFKHNGLEYDMYYEPLAHKKYKPLRFVSVVGSKEVFPYVALQQKADKAYQKEFFPKKTK